MFKEIKETTHVLINKGQYDDNFSSNKKINKEIEIMKEESDKYGTLTFTRVAGKRRERERKRKKVFAETMAESLPNMVKIYKWSLST